MAKSKPLQRLLNSCKNFKPLRITWPSNTKIASQSVGLLL